MLSCYAEYTVILHHIELFAWCMYITPSSFYQAYGEIPCTILNFLTDRAMETTKLPYQVKWIICYCSADMKKYYSTIANFDATLFFQPREYINDGDSVERAEAEKDADLGELSEVGLQPPRRSMTRLAIS